MDCSADCVNFRTHKEESEFSAHLDSFLVYTDEYTFSDLFDVFKRLFKWIKTQFQRIPFIKRRTSAINVSNKLKT